MNTSTKQLVTISLMTIASCLLAAPLQAKITLPAIISDHMVVQAEKKINIWGWADPGASITVRFAGQSQTDKADKSGAWRVTLNPVQSSTPLSMTITGKNTIHIKDILVGQVWLCSGQSNMEFPLARAKHGQSASSQATNRNIRLFHVPRHIATTPAPHTMISNPPDGYHYRGVHIESGPPRWVVCSPKEAAKFSAVGYYFGWYLNKKLHQPVGLIESAWGATPIEAWTSKAAMQKQPAFSGFLRLERQRVARYDPQKAKASYEHRIDQWKKKVAKAKTEGKKLPHRPRKPLVPGHNRKTPAVLFNGMIHPLIPFTIKGAIWYQGFANRKQAYIYRTLLATMIKDWRQRWDLGDFPFGIVQLPNYGKRNNHPGKNTPWWSKTDWWSVIRASQRYVAKTVPGAGLAVTIDIGSATRVHPLNKIDVGHRLALWALATAYGKDIIYSGPVYNHMQIIGNKVKLSFKHVDGGLVAKGHGGQLVGFTIAGADKKFHEAQATIDGHTIIVHSAAVKHPVAVRYAWASNPICSLYNKAGLPASPFRTDRWHVVTQPK